MALPAWLLKFVGFKAGAAWVLLAFAAVLLGLGSYSWWMTAEAKEERQEHAALKLQYSAEVEKTQKLKQKIAMLDNTVTMMSRNYLYLHNDLEQLEAKYEQALEKEGNRVWYDTHIPPDFLGGLPDDSASN